MIKKIRQIKTAIQNMLLFVLLVFTYSLLVLVKSISKKFSIFKKFERLLNIWVYSFDRTDTNGVSQLYLMELAFKNMAAKKTRTLVTIGGMAIGISFIVFLVSIGYGLQEVVVNRVARLDELMQAEVVPGLSADLSITDETMSKFQEIKNVDQVIPLIAVIGKVSYQNSISNLAVYATTSDYLHFSALQPIRGKIFESNNIYSSSGENIDIESEPQTENDNSNNSSAVLGVNDVINDGTLPVVTIASESATPDSQKVEKQAISSKEKKEIVVNQSVLQLLSIQENDAVGKVINLSFVVVGELLDDPGVRLESEDLDYKIVGVIPDEGTPIIYVPFMDIRSLGVNKYSQLKVIAKDKASLKDIRTTIESAGYGTVSVADTVAQIDSLFGNFRLILSVLGLVALSVAALGMFNTLTVSLLERTREVGLMKAMGLKSMEVRTLFLTESMIMGLYGGVLGLIMGVVVGKLLSVVLSALSVVKGVGFVDVSYVPLVFILFVLFLSVLVGILTGYYPAKRATRISALNALRYE